MISNIKMNNNQTFQFQFQMKKIQIQSIRIYLGFFNVECSKIISLEHPTDCMDS